MQQPREAVELYFVSQRDLEPDQFLRVEGSTITRGLNPLGEVTSAALKATGRVKAASARHVSDSNRDAILFARDTGKEVGYMDQDFKQAWGSSVTVACLFLAVVDAQTAVCLILSPDHGEGSSAYRRSGLGWVDSDTWFEDCTVSMVTIR